MKLYANSAGRARRAEFWYFNLFNLILAVIISVVAETIKAPSLNSFYTIAMFLPGFTVGMRRMHDNGRSGWVFLIPIYNLVLAATEGDRGSNEFGPDPKEFSKDGLIDQF